MQPLPTNQDRSEVILELQKINPMKMKVSESYQLRVTPSAKLSMLAKLFEQPVDEDEAAVRSKYTVLLFKDSCHVYAA